MSPKTNTYWILFILSNLTLFILWIISIQQFCTTNYFESKARLRRTSLVVLNIFCYLLLNALSYLHILYPHQTILSTSINIPTLWIVSQAIATLIGFHSFRVMFLFIIDILYTSSNIPAPKCLFYFVNTLQVLLTCCVLICHSMAIIATNQYWICLFYVIFGMQVLSLDICVIVLLQKPLKLLRQIQARNNQHINNGIRKFRAAQTVAVLIGLLALISIVFTMPQIVHIPAMARLYDFTFMECVMHSVVLIVLGIACILWIYKPNSCCSLPRESVCDLFCVRICFEDEDEADDHLVLLLPADSTKSKNVENKLPDSTHSINCTGNTQQTVTTF